MILFFDVQHHCVETVEEKKTSRPTKWQCYYWWYLCRCPDDQTKHHCRDRFSMGWQNEHFPSRTSCLGTKNWWVFVMVYEIEKSNLMGFHFWIQLASCSLAEPLCRQWHNKSLLWVIMQHKPKGRWGEGNAVTAIYRSHRKQNNPLSGSRNAQGFCERKIQKTRKKGLMVSILQSSKYFWGENVFIANWKLFKTGVKHLELQKHVKMQKEMLEWKKRLFCWKKEPWSQSCSKFVSATVSEIQTVSPH